MKYRRLGKTAMRVSVVGLGTWQLGGEWGKTFEQAEANAKAADLPTVKTTICKPCYRLRHSFAGVIPKMIGT